MEYLGFFSKKKYQWYPVFWFITDIFVHFFENLSFAALQNSGIFQMLQGWESFLDRQANQSKCQNQTQIDVAYDCASHQTTSFVVAFNQSAQCQIVFLESFVISQIQSQIVLKFPRCSFCVRLTAPLNLCPIYLKLLAHVQYNRCTCTRSSRYINRTKIHGGCQSYTKAAPRES